MKLHFICCMKNDMKIYLNLLEVDHAPYAIKHNSYRIRNQRQMSFKLLLCMVKKKQPNKNKQHLCSLVRLHMWDISWNVILVF